MALIGVAAGAARVAGKLFKGAKRLIEKRKEKRAARRARQDERLLQQESRLNKAFNVVVADKQAQGGNEVLPDVDVSNDVASNYSKEFAIKQAEKNNLVLVSEARKGGNQALIIAAAVIAALFLLRKR